MVNPYYESDGITIYHGNCREVLPILADCSVDSIVCDPPYELGFMGKSWDRSGIAYDVNVWRECLRVLRPGGHLLAFGGSRTYHRLACAIEDAGFEIRDQIQWLYGSGFPKSLDISRAIDAAAGVERERIASGSAGLGKNRPAFEGGYKSSYDVTLPATDSAKQWNGWGTALKPAHEPIVLARKPLDGTVAENVLKHGTGGINVDGCRIDFQTNEPDARIGTDTLWGGKREKSQHTVSLPAAEGITMYKEGRYPANIIHDGSDEVVNLFPDSESTQGHPRSAATNGRFFNTQQVNCGYSDSGSAARYFYCTKASKADREEGLDDLPVFSPGELTNRKDGSAGLNSPRAGAGRANSGGGRNTHPTVKPTDLMRYLCRLITPPRGIVLDPFCGSGSTGKAAMLEDFGFIGIELNEEYCQLAQRRIEAVTAQRGLFTPAVIDRPQAVPKDTVEQDDLFTGAPQ